MFFCVFIRDGKIPTDTHHAWYKISDKVLVVKVKTRGDAAKFTKNYNGEFETLSVSNSGPDPETRVLLH